MNVNFFLIACSVLIQRFDPTKQTHSKMLPKKELATSSSPNRKIKMVPIALQSKQGENLKKVIIR